MDSNKILFANLRSRQNPGNADKIGISGVDLCPLALIVFYAVIFGIIGEGFYNIFAVSCTMFCVKYFVEIII